MSRTTVQKFWVGHHKSDYILPEGYLQQARRIQIVREGRHGWTILQPARKDPRGRTVHPRGMRNNIFDPSSGPRLALAQRPPAFSSYYFFNSVSRSRIINYLIFSVLKERTFANYKLCFVPRPDHLIYLVLFFSFPCLFCEEKKVYKQDCNYWTND